MTFHELMKNQMNERIAFIKDAMTNGKALGKTKTEIASDLGMSVQALVQFVSRNGIKVDAHET